MDREKPPLNPALKDLADRERRNLGPHPTPEQLADYHAEKLSAEEDEAIRDHLALCPECSELYLDLVDFASPEPTREVSGLTDEDVDAAWQDMRVRLASGETAAKPLEAPPIAEARIPRPVAEPPPEARLDTPIMPPTSTVVPLQRPERARPSRVYQSLAAMFLLTTLGAGFWGLSLQRQLREPQVVTASLQLDPGRSGTRGEGATTRDRTGVTLFLTGVRDASRYRVDLQDARSGNVLWTKLVTPKDDSLRLILPARFLAPGQYLFRVYGLDREGAGVETDFLFSIAQ